MKRIAISTHKGGPGKTVTAINLSSGLARSKKKTLLIDLDPQGHATLGLGIETKLNEPSISDLLSDSKVPIERVIRKISDMLYLIPANIRLAKVAESLYFAVRKEDRLSHALSHMESYNFVIMDCPPSLGTLTVNALSLADFVIIPCEMGARAADGLTDLLETIFLLKGENFTNWRILLTKFDTRKTITNETVLEALKQHKEKILRTRIGVSESLNQAQIAGEDIFQFDTGGRGAQFYEDLTREIISTI